MDKDLIHIDDLVRQRLVGAEEEERPGAWLRMRELLDKELPLKPAPAAYDWRRLLAAAALILLGVVGGGTLWVQYAPPVERSSKNQFQVNAASNSISSRQANLAQPTDTVTVTVLHRVKSETVGMATVGTPTGGNVNLAPPDQISSKRRNNNLLIINAANGNLTDKEDFSNANNDVAGEKLLGSSALPTSSRKAAKDLISDSASSVGQRAVPYSEKRSGDLANASKPSLKQRSTPNLTISAPPTHATGSIKLAGEQESSLPLEEHTTSISPKGAHVLATGARSSKLALSASPAKALAENAGASVGKTSRQIAENGDRPVSGKNGHQHRAPIVQASLNTLTAKKQVGNRKSDSSRLFTLVRDTFQKITMRKISQINPLTRTSSYILDTLSVERISVEKWVPNTANEDPALASAHRSGMLKNLSPVPLSGQRVKSKKVSSWDPRTFNDIVRDAKFNLSQVRFYPGITGGINSSLFSPGGLTGFQLGMTSLFTFGEHWGASADLRFLYRINSQLLEDDYFRFDSSTVGGSVNYSRATVEHNFRFSSVQSLELPIALRYSWGRISALAGVNLVYNFRINAEQFDRLYDSTSIGITPYYNRVNDRPTIGIMDFNSRWTAGYVIGMNYQVTPAFSLDLRATQNVWNSMNTDGGQRLFNRLYNKPVFQFSVGYRFSRTPRFPVAR